MIDTMDKDFVDMTDEEFDHEIDELRKFSTKPRAAYTIVAVTGGIFGGFVLFFVVYLVSGIWGGR